MDFISWLVRTFRYYYTKLPIGLPYGIAQNDICAAGTQRYVHVCTLTSHVILYCILNPLISLRKYR